MFVNIQTSAVKAGEIKRSKKRKKKVRKEDSIIDAFEADNVFFDFFCHLL